MSEIKILPINNDNSELKKDGKTYYVDNKVYSVLEELLTQLAEEKQKVSITNKLMKIKTDKIKGLKQSKFDLKKKNKLLKRQLQEARETFLGLIDHLAPRVYSCMSAEKYEKLIEVKRQLKEKGDDRRQ